MFVAVRAQAYERIATTLKGFAPALGAAGIHQLAIYAVAGADGLFIARRKSVATLSILARSRVGCRTTPLRG